MRAAVRWGGVALATVAALVACRQLVGIGDAPPAGPAVDAGSADSGRDAPACGLAFADDACQTCVASRCCKEATSCAGSEPCAALVGCVGACGTDVACRARCVQEDRVGADPTVPAFEACFVRECASACGYVCGGVAEVANPDAAAACEACWRGNGCATAEACLADPACAAYAICTIESPTLDTVEACSQLLDGSTADASAFEGLSGSYCAAACEIGSSWWCVGHVSPPPGASGSLTIRLEASDAPSSTPVPGVTATLCGITDLGCAHAAASGVTGADGVALLVQQPEAGAGIVSSGYVDLEGAGIVPESFFWSFAISEHEAYFRVLTGTKGELDSILFPLGLTQDWSLGVVYVKGFDCMQAGAVGLTYDLQPSAKVLYQKDGAFPGTADRTDASGGAVFVNVPPGALTVTATSTALGRPIGTYSLFVRAGGFSEVYAFPR